MCRFLVFLFHFKCDLLIMCAFLSPQIDKNTCLSHFVQVFVQKSLYACIPNLKDVVFDNPIEERFSNLTAILTVVILQGVPTLGVHFKIDIVRSVMTLETN